MNIEEIERELSEIRHQIAIINSGRDETGDFTPNEDRLQRLESLVQLLLLERHLNQRMQSSGPYIPDDYRLYEDTTQKIAAASRLQESREELIRREQKKENHSRNKSRAIVRNKIEPQTKESCAGCGKPYDPQYLWLCLDNDKYCDNCTAFSAKKSCDESEGGT